MTYNFEVVFKVRKPDTDVWDIITERIKATSSYSAIFKVAIGIGRDLKINQDNTDADIKFMMVRRVSPDPL